MLLHATMFLLKNILQSLVKKYYEREEKEEEEEANISIPAQCVIDTFTAIPQPQSEVVPCNQRPELLVEHRHGIISKILTDSGVIDEQYHFNLRDAHGLVLEVGMRVTYSVFRRNEDEQWRVTRILTVHEEYWNDDGEWNEDRHEQDGVIDIAAPEPATVETAPALVTKIIGVVVKRTGRQVTVRDTVQKIDRQTIPRCIEFSLDNVVSSYIPEEGDYVILDATVEVDAETVNFTGDVVEVSTVRPLRARMETGYVTSWKKQSKTGMIDSAFFDMNACVAGYLPKLKDKVRVELIEITRNNRDAWRALTVEPLTFQQDLDDDVNQKRKVLPPRIDPDLAANKCNVIISEDTDLGLISLGENREFQICVTNNGKSNRTIYKTSFASELSQSQIKVLSPQQNQQILAPGQTSIYRFICHPSCFGYGDDVFVFDFRSFQIGRLISWEVISDELQKVVSKGTPLHQYDKKAHSTSRAEIAALQLNNEINRHLRVPGVRPSSSPNFVQVRMQDYSIPKDLKDTVLQEKHILNPADQMKALKERYARLFGPLTSENYKDRFHFLLYLLEIDASLDLGRFDMKRQSFKRAGPNGEYLALEVPGLAEKRPSLLTGDKLFAVRSSGGDNAAQFEGFIHRVLKNEVWIKFNAFFHMSYSGEDHDISFKLSCGIYRKSHYAIDLSLSRQALVWLFPQAVSSKPPQITFQEIELFSQNFSSNSCLVSGNDTAPDLTSSRAMDEMSPRIPAASSVRNFTESKFISMLKSQRKFSPGGTSNHCQNGATSPEANETIVDPANTSFKAQTHSSSKAISKVDDVLRNRLTDSNKQKHLKWVNPRLNARQQDAVRNILRGEGRPLPFIIFGPPGTGKTMTLVEAILQIYLMMPDSRILVATPSNSSADLIAERLLDSTRIQSGEMVRIVAYHLAADGKVPVKLQKFSTTVDINVNAPNEPQKTSYGVSQCSGQVIGRHRITVGTCATIGQLHNFRFRPGHFSHVFVDEAGQATEPEILIPLGFVSLGCTQSVLAGDPLQLGPVVPSKLAAKLGLSTSYLARILPRFPYQRDPIGFPETSGYDPRLVTRLNVNYRSLPDILELPSSLFYDSDLEAKIQDVDSLEANFLERFTKFADLPHSAVIFHGVQGSNELEDDSPSWFNQHEVYQVIVYMTHLTKHNVDPDDIGIITPYQKQVQKLRHALERLDLPVPKIGSVEEFQGQERLVIILSTVRSCTDKIKTDIRHSLGFVSCKERLNVAISRARALLIIVGNPYVLSLDTYWRSVLNYCLDRNSYIGCRLSAERLGDGCE